MSGVTLQQVEQALADLFSGFMLTTLDQGVVEVEVFQDYPNTQVEESQVYPSISVIFTDMAEEFFAADSEEEEQVSVDNSVSPPIATVRKTPEWYRVRYNIHAHSLDASADRDLLTWVSSRLRPKDSLVVNGEAYWIFREGFGTLDNNKADRRVYHKLWQFDVLVPIIDTTSERTVAQVTEIHMQTNVVETALRSKSDVTPAEASARGVVPDRGGIYPVDASGNIVTAVDAERKPGRTIAFDETDFWFPSGD